MTTSFDLVKPNLASLVISRIGNPVAGEIGDAVSASLGAPIARQLYTNSAPGGDKAIRMSGLGKCRRAHAYAARAVPEDPPADGKSVLHSKLAFIAGDIAEVLMATALREALDARASRMRLADVRGESGQQDVVLRLPIDQALGPGLVGLNLVDGVLSIDGHPDGVITVDGVPRAVLEVKSTRDYMANKWRSALARGEAPWKRDHDYWWQAQGYMHAMDLDRTYVLVYDKTAAMEFSAPDSDRIFGWWLQRDPEFMGLIRDHLEPALRHHEGYSVDVLTAFVDPVHAGGARHNPQARTPFPPCSWCPYLSRCAPGRVDQP